MNYPTVYFKLDQLSPNVRAWLKGATQGCMVDTTDDGWHVLIEVDGRRLWFWRSHVETEAERAEHA